MDLTINDLAGIFFVLFFCVPVAAVYCYLGTGPGGMA
jgi:hypothetical protein